MSDNVTTGIIGFFLVVLLAGYIALKPDRFEPLGGEPVPIETQIDGESKTVSAVLAWEQSGFKLYGLWFFPTKGKPVLYCEEHQLRWTLKDEYRAQVEARVAENPPVPRWRYFLGSLAVVYVVLVIFLINLLDTVIVDRKAWQTARQKNTFGSYKDYLVKDRKLKRFAGQARRRMMEKVGGYRTFYAYLTSGSEGEQREAMLRILDHIARSGDLNVGVSFEFENALQERAEMIDAELARVRRVMKSGGLAHADVREQAEQRAAELERMSKLKVMPVKPCFVAKHNVPREKLLTGLLDRVFSRIFPERILVLVHGDQTRAEIRIGYRVSNTSSLFRRESDSKLPTEKQVVYTGIQFDWDISLVLEGKVLLHRTLQSRPASTFTVTVKDPIGIYKAMAMSAFVDMGKSLLGEFGVESSLEMAAQPGDVRRLKKELFEQFVDLTGSAAEGLLEQIDQDEARAFFEQHGADIGAMMAGLALDLDNMMAVYTEHLAKGIEVGGLTFEAIAGLFED